MKYPMQTVRKPSLRGRGANCPKTVIARSFAPKQSGLHRRSSAKAFGILFALVVMFGVAPSVFADVYVTPTKIPLEIPIGSVTAATLSEYIVVLHQYLVSTAAIFAVIYMMFGGYRWIFAAGNKQHVASAQDMIWTSAVGLFLALTSYILLVTLNPQTVVFPKIPIPYLSDKELTAGSAKRICSTADVATFRLQEKKGRDWKGKDWQPTCSDHLPIKDNSGKTEVCIATRSERICAVTRNLIGEYTSAVERDTMEIRDLIGQTKEMKILPVTGHHEECGTYTKYPNGINPECDDDDETRTTCYYILGEPLVNDVEKDISFVKGQPQCAD